MGQEVSVEIATAAGLIEDFHTYRRVYKNSGPVTSPRPFDSRPETPSREGYQILSYVSNLRIRDIPADFIRF